MEYLEHYPLCLLMAYGGLDNAGSLLLLLEDVQKHDSVQFDPVLRSLACDNDNQ